jgi:hypothetical protein
VAETAEQTKQYDILPTLQLFHDSGAQIRCIVGPVGSGKTSAATWEMCYYLPHFLAEEHEIRRTRWVVVRNTYSELIDTTQKTVFDWFPWGAYRIQEKVYTLEYPKEKITVEIMFRSCDNPKDVKKFKSLEITGYWIDESIEVKDEIRKMLKNRIGRYPQKCPVRFGIETTNPPDVEDSTYYQFAWQAPPPGPVTNKKPLANHAGFWQPPYENANNLRLGYYDDIRRDYADSPDWVEMYVLGKPGVIVHGKLVYANFKRDYHVAKEPLVWDGLPLYMGWDNSGNCPAAVVAQIPTTGQAHVLAEYYSDKMGIVDFANYVIAAMNLRFPGHAVVQHWGDPAGETKYSQRIGGFTSNAALMRNECNINVQPSEQNLTARLTAVDGQLARIEGVLIDPSCTRLINGFVGGYCYPENKSIMGEYLPNILKNKYSHPHDALQYLFVKLFESKPREELTPSAIADAITQPAYDPLHRSDTIMIGGAR